MSDANAAATDANSHILDSAPANSLDLLFNTDPEALTDAQLDQMIAEMRAKRQQFLVAEATKASIPKPKTRKAANLDLKLSDLQLEI